VSPTSNLRIQSKTNSAIQSEKGNIVLPKTPFSQYHPIRCPRFGIRYCTVSLGKDTGRG